MRYLLSSERWDQTLYFNFPIALMTIGCCLLFAILVTSRSFKEWTELCHNAIRMKCQYVHLPCHGSNKSIIYTVLDEIPFSIFVRLMRAYLKNKLVFIIDQTKMTRTVVILILKTTAYTFRIWLNCFSISKKFGF